MSQVDQKSRILVFSPDKDLAQSLSMLFEDHYEMACETDLGNLQKKITASQPALFIVDLHNFSADVMQQLKIIEACHVAGPVVVLRAYNRLKSDVEDQISRIASVVFYKPINADEVVKTIHDLLKM